MSRKSKAVYNRRFVFGIAAIAAFGPVLFGFDTGIISGALLLIKDDPGLLTAGITMLPERTQEWIVSITVLAAGIGALTSGRLADRLGRKRVLIGAAFLFAIGATGLATASTVTSLLIWRAVVGLVIGMESYTVPLYISEISPAKVRGALVSINQLAITVGIFLSYIMGLIFSGMAEGWRWMFLVGLVPSLILGIGMLFLPETPRWLMANMKEENARKVLDRIGEEDSEGVLRSIRESLSKESEKSGKSWKILLSPWVRPALIIGAGVMFIQTMTGVDTMVYYSPTIFEMAGFGVESSNPVFQAILPSLPVGFVNILFTILSIYLVDRWGRKPLLYLGLSGMILALLALGAGFTFYDRIGGALKWVSFSSIILFIPFFAFSLGPVAWLLVSEIFPTRIRGFGMSIAAACNWFSNTLVTNTFLSLGKATTGVMTHPDGTGTLVNPGGAFFVYALVGILGLIFAITYIPETKGRSLEEIEQHFLAGKHPRKL